MPQTCKIWTDFQGATVTGDAGYGYDVISARAGNYKISDTLLNISEFTDLTVPEKVRLTDYILEQNSQGITPSFDSGDIDRAIRRPKKTTVEREIAFLKLVYEKDPNLGAKVGMADGSGLVGANKNYGNPKYVRFQNDLNRFQASTSSRIVDDVHQLAKSLIEAGKLTKESTTTRYILSSETFKEIEEGRLGLSTEFYGDSSSISRFLSISAAINGSQIDSDLRRIILNDLDQARLNYISGSYKSCIVMLGAALEGMMLGTLRRSDVISFLRTNPSLVQTKLASAGPGHPQFKELIGDTLKFEEIKSWLIQLFPKLAGAGVGEIQDFRNAIHPNKSLKDSTFTDFDETRATHYITAFEKIIQLLMSWSP